MSIGLRPRTAADDELLRRLFLAARTELLAAPLPAPALETLIAMQLRAQEQHYLSTYPSAQDQMVTQEGVTIGRLLLDHGDDEVRIIDIVLLDEYRGRGIGTQLISHICADAGVAGLPVRLSVLAQNPARRLYGRLGFYPVQRGTVAPPYEELEWTSADGIDAGRSHE